MALILTDFCGKTVITVGVSIWYDTYVVAARVRHTFPAEDKTFWVSVPHSIFIPHLDTIVGSAFFVAESQLIVAINMNTVTKPVYPSAAKSAAATGTPFSESTFSPSETAAITAPEPSPNAYTPRLRELPEDLRPRERIRYAGASALSNAELLAIMLRMGLPGENVLRMAERIITHFGGLSGLARAHFDELCAVPGIGEAKAAQVQAALELGKRLMIAAPDERPVIRTPTDVANLLMLEMGLLEQEHLRTVLLDTKNFVLRIPTVYTGNVNTMVVRVAEIFREAIRANSPSIILAHNHPSGDPTPSPEDVRITEMVVEAGNLLDIEVLDHLVIGRNRFISMKERGLGFA